MRELGRRFEAAQPEVAFVLTPHNVHLDGAFAVILGARTEGELQGSPEPISLSCPIDMRLALLALGALQASQVPAAGVSYGTNEARSATMPMDWGALIPLWYMGGRRAEPIPVVLVCPSRTLDGAAHVEAGRALALAAATSGRRVALIASADHGHGHDVSGPYGLHAASAEYDQRVTGLVSANRLQDLLDFDPEFVQEAQVDSWWQMLMLHGAIGEGFGAELISYEAPTYFGMLCAAYEPLG
jgi:aromatic ring-opening dioxygenase LigB subunit